MNLNQNETIPLSNQQIATVVRDAKKLLEEQGRCRHDMVNESGQYCMLGALATALGVDISGYKMWPLDSTNNLWGANSFRQVRYALSDFIVYNGYGVGIASLNDHEDTTDKMVICVLEQFADFMEEPCTPQN